MAAGESAGRRQDRVTPCPVTTPVSASTGWGRLATATTESSSDPGAPAISTRWISEAPGLDPAPTFRVLTLSAIADRRDIAGNPRRGGRYAVRLERHADRSLNRYSFNRVSVELEQHFSWWRGQRLLTLRGIAVSSDPDRDSEVPIYLQPTLGGSQLLRGFVPDRFRDRNLLALQAEYAWDIWPFLNAVLFYETGQVARHWQDLRLNDVKRDYGIGFRFGSARTIALRTDVALGSGEGTRISMRFSHAF